MYIIIMNEYLLKLKYTRIEMPPEILPESKDFPKARVRTATPKEHRISLEFNSSSRPSSPKANLTRLS